MVTRHTTYANNTQIINLNPTQILNNILNNHNVEQLRLALQAKEENCSYFEFWLDKVGKGESI